jgi:hypothetical protein
MTNAQFEALFKRLDEITNYLYVQKTVREIMALRVLAADDGRRWNPFLHRKLASYYEYLEATEEP